MAKTSPTQRTIAWAKQLPGYRRHAIVEHWNPHVGIRQDLFGFIDIIVLVGEQTLAIQATSGSNVAARVTKIRAERAEALADVLAAGWVVLVIGWRKLKPRGTKVARWTPRVLAVDELEALEWNPPSDPTLAYPF